MGPDVSKGCVANPKGEEIFLDHYLTIGYESATILKTMGTMHLTTQRCMPEGLIHDHPMYTLCPDLLSMVGETS